MSGHPSKNRTHPSKSDKSYADLEYHRGVDYYFENIKCESRTAVRETEYDGRHRESGHAEVEKDIGASVDESVCQPFGYFAAGEGIDGTCSPVKWSEQRQGALNEITEAVVVCPTRGRCSAHPFRRIP